MYNITFVGTRRNTAVCVVIIIIVRLFFFSNDYYITRGVRMNGYAQGTFSSVFFNENSYSYIFRFRVFKRHGGGTVERYR